jgi:hypothetical protein
MIDDENVPPTDSRSPARRRCGFITYCFARSSLPLCWLMFIASAPRVAIF